MILATHYYRPPFPEKKHWERDIEAMRGAGLHAVQLWLTWAWVEAEPGRFDFEDYDELIAIADKHGLKIILSVLGELHPEWIHRLEPGAHMIDHTGRKVISSHRVESNQGLTPGGCTDHPGLLARMGKFLEAIAQHYKNDKRVLFIDAWNELRWNIHCDGYVCHCEHTLAAFRKWLGERHGGLGGLSKAWHRRLVAWEDVFPPKAAGRPYSESMAFQQFLQERAHEHLRWRTAILRRAGLPVFAHNAAPCYEQCGDTGFFQQACCRGNDWVHTLAVDGYGTSHFPNWGARDDIGFLARLDAIASMSAGTKCEHWLSELQGGASNYGQDAAASVTPEMQQFWLWAGIAAGAKGSIFWSWSDEVFGREAGGFGFTGNDGLANERVNALKKLRAILDEKQDELNNYEPEAARAGVFLDIDNLNLESAETVVAAKSRDSIKGWLRAFVLSGAKPVIVEATRAENFLNENKALKLLALPCAFVVSPAAANAIIVWVKSGGTLLLEGDTDGWNAEGFYRTHPEDRPFLRELGIEFAGRRQLVADTINVELNGEKSALPCAWQRFPLRGEDGRETDFLEKKLGKGRILAFGGFPGIAAEKNPEPLAKFIRQVAAEPLANTRVEPMKPTAANIIVRGGLTKKSDGSRRQLVFVFNTSGADVFARVFVRGKNPLPATDWLSGGSLSAGQEHAETGEVFYALKLPENGIAILELG